MGETFSSTCYAMCVRVDFWRSGMTIGVAVGKRILYSCDVRLASPESLHSGNSDFPWESSIARFLSHVDTSGGPDACHPWTASVSPDGYGNFGLPDGSCIGAHRFALAMKLGRPLGRDEVTRHASVCITRSCCNQGHLRPGTVADNNRDMVEAGRRARGERHAHARLSPSDVLAILGAPDRRAKEVAEQYGVTDRQIYHLRAGKRWRHVTALSAPVST